MVRFFSGVLDGVSIMLAESRLGMSRCVEWWFALRCEIVSCLCSPARRGVLSVNGEGCEWPCPGEVGGETR